MNVTDFRAGLRDWLAELVGQPQHEYPAFVAALSLINIVLVFIGLAFALRFGVKLRD